MTRLVGADLYDARAGLAGGDALEGGSDRRRRLVAISGGRHRSGRGNLHQRASQCPPSARAPTLVSTARPAWKNPEPEVVLAISSKGAIVGATLGIAEVETFDHFTYSLKVGKKSDDNYFFTVSVNANLPKGRTPGKDERLEDRAKLDQEFQDKQRRLEEKLKQEKQFEKWIYLVPNWTVEPLLKERLQLLVERNAEPRKDESFTNRVDSASESAEPKK